MKNKLRTLFNESIGLAQTDEPISDKFREELVQHINKIRDLFIEARQKEGEVLPMSGGRGYYSGKVKT